LQVVQADNLQLLSWLEHHDSGGSQPQSSDFESAATSYGATGGAFTLILADIHTRAAMKNKEIAEMFYEIADFLEIQEVEFKPRAKHLE
jgi:hypothetical protein